MQKRVYIHELEEWPDFTYSNDKILPLLSKVRLKQGMLLGRMKDIGFETIEDWPSVYWHPAKKCILVVYVDDFKMSGPSANLAKGWSLIREGLLLEDPAPVDRCLGCHHAEATGTVTDVESSSTLARSHSATTEGS